jgi:hypothetical protein
VATGPSTIWRVDGETIRLEPKPTGRN